MGEYNTFENLANHLGNMAIYVIRRDNHRILYYNDLVKAVAPNVEIGKICDEVWAGTCENCPLNGMGDKETNSTINFDDPFGEIVDISATKSEWGEEMIPAYIMTVKPHVMMKDDIKLTQKRKLKEKVVSFTLNEIAGYVFDEILYFNLTKGILLYRREHEKSEESLYDEILDFDKIVSMIHPDDREEYVSKFSKDSLYKLFSEGKTSQHMECRKIEKDGKYHWCSITIRKVDGGEDITALVLIANIEVRKQLVKEKNDLIACIMTLFGEFLVVDIKTGKINVYKNDEQLEKIRQKETFDSFNRMYGKELIHPNDQERFFEVFAFENIKKFAKEGKQGIALEVRRKISGGEYRYCELIGAFLEDDDGEKSRLVLTFRDTDDLVKARLEEKYANQRFTRAVNDTYDAIYEGELYTDYLKCWTGDDRNSWFKYHSSVSEQIQWATEQVIHPDYRDKYKKLLSTEYLKEQFQKGRSEITVQAPRMGDGGVYRWFSMQIQLLEMTGSCIRVMYYLKDIDDVKKEEERKQKELQNALAVAEKASKAKTDFLSRMSHDIRTPLNVIIGMASIARNNLSDEDKIDDCLVKVEVSANFLLSLINDILDMSKIESGKMELAEREMNLKDLIHSIVTMCEVQAEEKQHEFSVELGPELKECYIGDSLRLNQILMNLLSNALKYTPSHGKINLSVTAEEEREGCQKIRMSVSDTGLGMSPEFMKNMFEPFEQEYSGGGRVFEGTGLGLSITKKLVEMMGGTITASSEVGKGSTFTVILSMKLVKEDTGSSVKKEGNRQRRQEAARYNFSDICILLVEDNELNREIAETVLGQQGMVVDAAVNGQEAVDKFRESAVGMYQAILMDIRMPVMNGLEATRQIRAMEREDAQSVPIIAMTANAFLDEQEEAFAAGINDYLTKPIDPKVMYHSLKQCLLFRLNFKVNATFSK